MLLKTVSNLMQWLYFALHLPIFVVEIPLSLNLRYEKGLFLFKLQYLGISLQDTCLPLKIY